MTQEIEEAKRKRVNELAEVTAAAFEKVCSHLDEMVAELGVPLRDAAPLVKEHIASHWAEDAWETMVAPPGEPPMAHEVKMRLPPREVMRRTIERLFKEAPPLTDAEGVLKGPQAPAMKCAIMFRSGAQVEGVLSTTPEGGLRIAVPNKMKTGRGEVPVIVEQFFDYGDVTAIARVCELPDMRSSITLATR